MSPSLNILLVDDNDELRDATRELLEEHGHAVSVSARGDDALRLAQQMAPPIDLLVSDVLMPGLNGVELTDRLVARNPQLPVVLMSSRSGEPSLTRRLISGDVAFVSKPFASDELLAKIDDARKFAGLRVQASGGSQGQAAKHGTATTEPTPAKGSRAESRRPSTALGSRGGWLPLAAVVVLAIAAGLAWRSLEPGPPPLAPPVVETVTRSVTIDSPSPKGPIPRAPTLLSWGGVDAAVSYAVDLRLIDDTVLWRSEVDRPEIELPLAIAETLDRAVIYTWRVEAFDSAQQRLATSGPVLFSIDLAADETGVESPGG